MDKGVGKGKKALQPAVYNRINHWLRKFNRESLLFWGKIGTIRKKIDLVEVVTAQGEKVTVRL